MSIYESPIYEQANKYIAGQVSYSEIHRWVYDRIEYYFSVELDGTPDAELASQLVGRMAEYDLDVDIFGSVAEAEAAFRRSLAAYLRTEAQTRPEVAVSVSSQSS